MSILLRRIAAAAVLLALALCMPQGSLLLCVGDGGHVALEAACDPGSAVAHAEEHSAEVADHCECSGDCGPCSDAQFGVELTAGRVRDDSAGTSGLLLPPATVFVALAAFAPDAGDAHALRVPATWPPPGRLSPVQSGNCLRI